MTLSQKLLKLYTPDKDTVYSANDFDDLNDYFMFYGAFRSRIRDILSILAFKYPSQLMNVFKEKYFIILLLNSFMEFNQKYKTPTDHLENGFATYDSIEYVYIIYYLFIIYRYIMKE